MKKFWSTSAKVHSLFISRSSETKEIPASFPKFSELPPELRDQIWVYSLEQRAIPLHLRQYPHGESDIEIHAQGDTESEGQTHMNNEEIQNEEIGEVTTGNVNVNEDGDGDDMEFEVEESENDNGVDVRNRFYTMAILTCSTTGRCKCTYAPPSSIHSVPSPAAFSVCHESRDATRHLYSKYLEAEYDVYGLPATGSNGIPLAVNSRPRTPRPGQKPSPWDDIKSPDYPYPYRTGVFINPSVDALMIDMNIASSGSIQELHHFVNIMSKQLPNISRMIISTVIALPPYKWWQKERFGYWKTMGQDAKWVPRNVVNFGQLRDVVVLTGGKTHEKMLPEEWRERTVNIWNEELEKIRERWPEEWVSDGPPALKVVGKLEDM